MEENKKENWQVHMDLKSNPDILEYLKLLKKQFDMGKCQAIRFLAREGIKKLKEEENKEEL